MTINRMHWFVLIVLAVVWGSSFILIKLGLVGLTPIQLGAGRVLISALVLLPLLPSTFKTIPRARLFDVFLVGLVGSGVPPFLFAVAQTRVDSAVAGMINATVPVWAFLIGWIWFRLAPNRYRILGILCGFGGAVLLMASKGILQSASGLTYGLLILAATMCYGTSVNLIKARLSGLPALGIAVYSFILVAPFAALILAFHNPESMWANAEALRSLGAVALLAALGTAGANILFFWLTQQTGPVYASSVTYLIPITAMFWGALDGEGIGWLHFLGLALILLGVYLISLGGRRAKA